VFLTANSYSTTLSPGDTLGVGASLHTGAEHGGAHLFTELLDHVYDSHQIQLPFAGEVGLPYILVDEGKVYTFRNLKSLRESGTFTIERQGIVRATDHQSPMLDLSITKHVIFLWLAALILVLVSVIAARKNRKNLVPTGIGNLMEIVVLFIRDEIAIPTMGPDGVKYLPYLLTTFCFILIMNLMGLVPYGATATGNVNVTGGLAVVAFIMIQFAAIRAQGLGHYLKHLTGDVPWVLWPIMIPIEILGLFAKPFALMIRLFANMSAGHIVIFSLLGLIFLFRSYFIGPISVGFAVGISLLEILVGLIQAYVFTILTSLFMGLGMQPATGEDVHEH
jgi:ATP synthase subunit 6